MLTALLAVSGLLLLGCGVGVVITAVGIGGGVLMVPAFMGFVPAMDAHTAKGTSLFIIGFVAAVAVRRGRRGGGGPPWSVAAWMAAGSVLGAFTAAWLTARLPERLVVGGFLALLLWLAVQTFLLKSAPRPHEVRRRPGLSVLVGLGAGAASGATGTGGGLVLVPLSLIAGVTTNGHAVLLSNMVMIATSAAGTLAHLTAPPEYPSPWTIGQVWLPPVPLVLLGTLAGMRAGERANRILTLPRRRALMGALLLLIAAQMARELL